MGYIYLITEDPNPKQEPNRKGGLKKLKLCGEKFFKIGYSKYPKKRLSQIQVGFPKKLILARQRFVKEHKVFEKFLHLNFEQFKDDSLRGEWFFGDIEKVLSFFDELGIKYGFDPFHKINDRLLSLHKKKNMEAGSKTQKPKRKKRKKNLYSESFKHSKDYFSYQKRKNWTF